MADNDVPASVTNSLRNWAIYTTDAFANQAYALNELKIDKVIRSTGDPIIYQATKVRGPDTDWQSVESYVLFSSGSDPNRKTQHKAIHGRYASPIGNSHIINEGWKTTTMGTGAHFRYALVSDAGDVIARTDAPPSSLMRIADDIILLTGAWDSSGSFLAVIRPDRIEQISDPRFKPCAGYIAGEGYPHH